MAGTTNFIQTNPAAANQENDATYATDSLTTGGVGVDDILPSPWLNKVWFQCTTFICALAYVMANWGSGFNILDSNLATLKAQILAFFQTFVTTASYTSGSNANGYWQKDPSGLIRQWGNILGSGSISTGSVITFPTAFTTLASISVVVTGVTIFGHGIGFASIENSTLTTGQVTLEVGAVSSIDGVYWEATGY